MAPDAIGGGYVASGIEGSYFANPALQGEPAFTRRDVRIDFDWGTESPIGGSRSERLRSFPQDGFSVRWSGQLRPRFSEPYTLFGRADDGVRIFVRKPGDPSWRTLVDRWEQAGDFEAPALPMKAGQAIDIRVEYREAQAKAAVSLWWKSPSTPAEVIDPVAQQGLNLAHWGLYLWADLMKSSRYGENEEKVDANGWPTQSGVELVMSEMGTSDRELAGTYLFGFRGQATTRQHCCDDPVFRTKDGVFEMNLPKGAGYDAASQTTSSQMTLEGSRSMLIFEEAQRSPDSREDGVTNIRLMRPLMPGSDAHHRSDEVVYRPFAEVVSTHFSTLRTLHGANVDSGETWADRTRPDHAFFIGPKDQENLEYLVMLANETGKDLYLTTPVAANDEYFEKLARLLRYGSDGVEPYSKPTSSPQYPPLNPNLRVYVEVGNEIWNWAFASTGVAQRKTVEAAQARSAEWLAIDYDGRAGDPEHSTAVRRWHALRTVQCSKIFRKVWGDASIGTRVRMVLPYQYDNYQDTALSSLDFIDGYFNNRAGEYVTDPHPVSYYLWGAGGASYYGLANNTGTQDRIVLAENGFEAPMLEDDTLRMKPSGSAWTFEGQAGIIRPAGATRIDGVLDASVPTDGKQAAVFRGPGSIRQTLQFTKRGTYALSFNATGRGEPYPGYLPFDIYVDDEKVSARSQVDIRPSAQSFEIGGWARERVGLKEVWGSTPFEVDAGKHTIRFVAHEEEGQYLLIDKVRIHSANAMMTSGFDSGEAEGQVGDANYARQLEAQARYSRAFGLQVVAYEAGWSVGGDFTQMPLQNWAKFRDPRVAEFNDRAIRAWDQSGSFMNVWGVYEYWPSYDFANARTYPIMRSIGRAATRLRTEPSFGRRLPATLSTEDADWKRVEHPNPSWWERHLPWCNKADDQWYSWMLIAPDSASYRIELRGEGQGSVTLELDGEPLTRFRTFDEGSRVVHARMTSGAHAIRVVTTGGANVERVRITPDESSPAASN